MALTDLKIIGRSLTARLFSTVVTALSVGVAVGLMLVLLSMREAAYRAFERGTGNMHLVVGAENDPLTVFLNNVLYARPPRAPIEWARFQEIAASYPLEWAIPIQHGDSFRGYPVLSTTPEFFSRFTPDPDRPWRFARGRAFEGDFQAVLGAGVAAGTGLGVGDPISLTHGVPDSRGGGATHVHDEFEFRVVGVLEPNGTAHDNAVFISLQSAWILHAHDRREREGLIDHAHEDEQTGDHDHDAHQPPTTAADLTDADRKITGIYLRVAAMPVLQQVFDMLRRQQGITVASPQQEVAGLRRIVSNIDEILLAMALAVMVSSGIGIMLALYNSMEQRRRQIAVLRVLGCSRTRVLGLVLTESALLGTLGAIVGVALAAVGGVAFAAATRARLGLAVEPTLSLEWTLAVALGAVALATLAGVIPAVMAYRTGVAKNLRPMA